MIQKDKNLNLGKKLKFKSILKIITDNLHLYDNFDFYGFRDWLTSLEERGLPIYWDSLTYYRVYNIKANLYKDYDEITVITGYEGSGKSVLASQIACCVSPDFSIQRVGYDPEDLIRMFDGVKKGDTIWIDEGALFLFSRNSSRKENKIIIQLLSIVRQMNLHLIICVPNFFIIDTYLRDHRIKNLFHIVKNRKAFTIFNRNSISYLNYHGKSVKNVSLGFKHINPNDAIVGTWTGDFGRTEFFKQKDYLKLKDENMEKFKRLMNETLSGTIDNSDVNTDIVLEKRSNNNYTPPPSPLQRLGELR